MTIKTEFVNPPIPFRGWDWIAWNAEENGDEITCQGSGATEQEAIQDFKDQHGE